MIRCKSHLMVHASLHWGFVGLDCEVEHSNINRFSPLALGSHCTIMLLAVIRLFVIVAKKSGETENVFQLSSPCSFLIKANRIQKRRGKITRMNLVDSRCLGRAQWYLVTVGLTRRAVKVSEDHSEWWRTWIRDRSGTCPTVRGNVWRQWWQACAESTIANQNSYFCEQGEIMTLLQTRFLIVRQVQKSLHEMFVFFKEKESKGKVVSVSCNNPIRHCCSLVLHGCFCLWYAMLDVVMLVSVI